MSEARRQRRERQRANDSFSSVSRELIRDYAPQAHTINRGYGYEKVLYQTNWLAARVVDVVAEDMTREGIEIDGLSEDSQAKILQAMTSTGAWESVTQAIKEARSTGGSGLIPLIKGHKLEEPLDVTRLSKSCIDGFIVRERMDLTPVNSTDLINSGRHYGLPQSYRETFLNEVIDHSRVIRFIGRKLPYRDLRQNNFWGDSVLKVILDDITGYTNAKVASGELIRYAYLRTLSVDGLSDMLRSGCDNEILSRFKTVSELQSYYNITLMDGKDSMATMSYNFAGLPDIVRQFIQSVSGSEGIPMTKLMGQSPDGMNATGESDLANYESNIKMRQESDLREPITFLVNLFHIHLFGKQLPEGCEIKFNSLRMKSESEEVDIELKEAQVNKTKAETLDIYAGGNSGAIMSVEQFKRDILNVDLDDVDVGLSELDNED